MVISPCLSCNGPRFFRRMCMHDASNALWALWAKQFHVFASIEPAEWIAASQQNLALRHIPDASNRHLALCKNLFVVFALKCGHPRRGQNRSAENPWTSWHSDSSTGPIINVDHRSPFLGPLGVCELADSADRADCKAGFTGLHLQLLQNGDDALQTGIDVRMTAGVITRLGQRVSEVFLNNGG